MALYRLQGRAQQLHILDALPMEIQGLLNEFAQQRERDRELQEAKERHVNEHW